MSPLGGVLCVRVRCLCGVVCECECVCVRVRMRVYACGRAHGRRPGMMRRGVKDFSPYQITHRSQIIEKQNADFSRINDYKKVQHITVRPRRDRAALDNIFYDG